MSKTRREHLIARLQQCPCCRASVRETNTQADGIPDGMDIEHVYDCGAAVFVSDRDTGETGRPCPSTMDSALATIEDAIDDDMGNTTEDESE